MQLLTKYRICLFLLLLIQVKLGDDESEDEEEEEEVFTTKGRVFDPTSAPDSAWKKDHSVEHYYNIPEAFETQEEYRYKMERTGFIYS